MKFTRVLLLALLIPLAALSVSAQTAQVSTSKLTFVGAATLTGADTTDETEVGFYVAHAPDVNVRFSKPQISGTISPARVPADHAPRPAGNPIHSGSFFGFLGLTHRDQRFAPTGVTGGRNFSLEPPDQGLAVGNGFIVEAVNDAIAVFDTSGTRLSRKALSLFLNLPPSILAVSPTKTVFGPFLSDPRVYFDWNTGHFFFTVLEIDLDAKSGAFGKASKLFIAVSKTNVPTGTWNIFQLDVTNDGDDILPGTCPCFGDQPLIGADKFGFYINTNAFSLATFSFRGTQIYAISKKALETGTPPSVTATRLHDLRLAESFAFSIQPATVPPNGSFDLNNGGTEFFVSSLDFTATLDDRLAVWALTNTSSLDTTPNLHLTHRVTTTQVYGQSPDAEQKPGPTPLRDAIAVAPSSFPFGQFNNHLELVTSNDDRMQQVIFADGKLWTALNTVVKTQKGPDRTGVAFFILTPSFIGGQVEATVFNQGYVAINSPSQNSVMYPSIGVNSSGKAVIAFSVVGQDFFPSAAFATLDANSGAGPIVISGPGVLPDDGFSGYVPFRSARWGDYSAAVADEHGAIWLGNEMIPNAPRSLLANWGTFITKVTP